MRLGPLQELVLEGPRISKLLFKALSAYSGSLVKLSLHTVRLARFNDSARIITRRLEQTSYDLSSALMACYRDARCS